MANEVIATKSELAVAQGDTVRASWNTSLDHIRANTGHFSPDEQEALIGLFRWCIDPRHPMRCEEAARRLGCSSNLLYQLLRGIYRNPDKSLRRPSAELIQKINQFLELERKRFEAGETQFVLTPTAKKFFTAAELARESQSPVFVVGPSHIGKTWAAEHFTAANNHGRTFYARMEAASGLGGMVRRMAESAGISDKSNTAALIARVTRATTPNTLWILDELHLLAHTYRKSSFHNCMEVIRGIYDETHCGMVLIFTILDDVRAASQKELQQLWRRGVHKFFLPTMPTKGDLGAILQHNGMNFPDPKLKVTVGDGGNAVTESPYEILRQLARRDGLKAITERLRYGRKLAGKGTGRLAWTHFVEAHLRIEGESVIEDEWT